MLASDNTKISSDLPSNPDDVNIGELIGALEAHSNRSLVFSFEGRRIKPGYHVTEVKAGQFAALDCGANPESWTEIFIQLWDVNEDEAHMTARKFNAIIRKVADHLNLDNSAKLTFEVSDGVAPMQLHRASYPSIVGDEVHVDLSPRPASCKPRDRWLEEQNKASASCATATEKPCCG